MESGTAVLGSHSETHWKYRKIEHKNGLKFEISFRSNILM